MGNDSIRKLLGDLEAFPDEKHLKVEANENLNSKVVDLLVSYEDSLCRSWGDMTHSNINDCYDFCLKSLSNQCAGVDNEVISTFLVHTSTYSERKKYSEITGLFITALLQTAFDNNQNNFDIMLASQQPLSFLGHTLHGRWNRRLILKVRESSEWKMQYSPLIWFECASHLEVMLVGANNVQLPALNLDCKYKTDEKNILLYVNDTIRPIKRTTVDIIKRMTQVDMIKIEKHPV
ncbi:MAG: hypothetical protein HY438_01970 [DPANN group archaeon]|nr:hypothetical protein [DPANN group archaeon]